MGLGAVWLSAVLWRVWQWSVTNQTFAKFMDINQLIPAELLTYTDFSVIMLH